MRARTQRGWLTDEALQRGFTEQYAVMRSYGRVTITLGMTPSGDYVVTEKVDNDDSNIAMDWVYERKADARRQFTKLVRNHP